MKRAAIILVCVLAGCGGKIPQYSAKEQALLKRLSEQIDKHSLPACKQLCQQAEDLHKKDQLSDKQFAPLKKICAKTQAQRWDEAKSLVDAVIAGQEAGAK
jgi:hypothetical protein